MIAYRMLYAVVVGLPILLAAFVGTAALRRHGRPERWVWLVGLLLALVLPGMLLLRPLGLPADPETAASGEVEVAAEPAIATGSRLPSFPNVLLVERRDAGFGLDESLLLAWVLASAGLALRWLVSRRRLGALADTWRRGSVDGADVWLTPASGPAVTGALRSRILVPTWLLDLPAEQRSLVMLHEQEHVRARDPWLMAVCRIARILTPWNPVVWLLGSRLLRAVELDCDRRVLRRHPDVRTYCDTLFAISARQPSRLVGAAAFAESRVPLNQRIIFMTMPPRSMSHITVLLLFCVGALLVVGSCGVPLPTERDADPRESVVDPSEGNLVVTVDGDGRVTVDGEPTAMEDVSVRAAEIAAGESVALVTTIRADRAVPYRHIEELQHELVDAGLTRVVFVTDDIAEGGNGLRIVLPESNEGLSVSARNFLSLTVQPSGIVEVKRGESPAVQQMLALQLTGLWRAEASRNPNLIAAISTHEDTQYSHVLAVLDALYEANAQRISLWGIFAL